MPPENNTKPECFLIISWGYRNGTLTQNRLKFIFIFSQSNQKLFTSFSIYFVIFWQNCQLNIKIQYNLIQLFFCNKKRNEDGGWFPPWRQSPIAVPRKRYSANMQQIYRRTSMPKCYFNKVALQLYRNRTSAWVFSCSFAAYFQSTFS